MPVAITEVVESSASARQPLMVSQGDFLNSRDNHMSKQYIEKIDDVYRIAGTRVSLDSIVYAFWRGQTAESIAQSFPVLTLEQVYGALTFYLANKSQIDSYLKKAQIEFEAIRKAAHEEDPMFYKKLADARPENNFTAL